MATKSEISLTETLLQYEHTKETIELAVIMAKRFPKGKFKNGYFNKLSTSGDYLIFSTKLDDPEPLSIQVHIYGIPELYGSPEGYVIEFDKVSRYGSKMIKTKYLSSHLLYIEQYAEDYQPWQKSGFVLTDENKRKLMDNIFDTFDSLINRIPGLVDQYELSKALRNKQTNTISK
jgi:hypothetical protein